MWPRSPSTIWNLLASPASAHYSDVPSLFPPKPLPNFHRAALVPLFRSQSKRSLSSARQLLTWRDSYTFLHFSLQGLSASEIILVTCGLVSGVIALLSHPISAAPSKCYVPRKQILNEWLLAFIYNLQELNATLNLFHNLPFGMTFGRWDIRSLYV